jgi:chemotaxis-related protein WspD
MPAGFREEWTRSLAAAKSAPPSDQVRVLVFRVWTDRLALPLTAFQEAVRMGPVRTVPLMSGKVFKGLVNVRGELLPCLSVGDLLGIEPPTEKPAYPWLLVASAGEERFAFPASEILGVTHVTPERLQPPPVTVAKFPDAVVRHVFQMEAQAIGLLDAERFVQALRRSLVR